MGSGPGQMNCPRSLTVDSKGYILVTDKINNRILVLNPEMTDARQLPLPPLDTPMNVPRAICFVESLGRLYVGEFGGQQRILGFDNVFNLSSLFTV
jgi:streptogramin lyase